MSIYFSGFYICLSCILGIGLSVTSVSLAYARNLPGRKINLLVQITAIFVMSSYFIFPPSKVVVPNFLSQLYMSILLIIAPGCAAVSLFQVLIKKIKYDWWSAVILILVLIYFNILFALIFRVAAVIGK